MNLVNSKEARRILSVEGRPINIRTFDRLITEGIIETHGVFTGRRVFDESEILSIAKHLPKKRPPSRHGIVSILKAAMDKQRKRKA